MKSAYHDGMYNVESETEELTVGCQVCASIGHRYEDEHKGGPRLAKIQLHAEYSIIRGKKSKEKSSFLGIVAKTVSALRNSGGGVLLVHVEGISSEDKCLEYFDEFVVKTFTNLLEGGELYTDSYERYFLSDEPKFTDVSDVLVVKVSETAGVVTVDFNTKANNDNENLVINSLTLLEVLNKTETNPKDQAILRNLPCNVHTFYEDRHIQLKAFKDNTEQIQRIQANVGKLTDHIWHILKLKDNITSMSKLVQGGSYYLGVNEKKVLTERGYQTKVSDIVGFKLHVNQASLIESIYRKVETDLCVLTRHGKFTDAPSDLINIAFHPTQRQHFVMEVAIRYCDGVVFYDRDGPRSYILDEKLNTVRRMNNVEWLEKFRSTHEF
ncbi:uncharacterized protein LOC125378646 [Haliotis rufescens]|uniref:uncharacterized protein LOC125378646 n=1 Tax=Haliotis rufescens TaxID=6454 RepID=UPI00201F9813|nr:uncharacterized protein LOC125378646 [Haliotis rufescens]